MSSECAAACGSALEERQRGSPEDDQEVCRVLDPEDRYGRFRRILTTVPSTGRRTGRLARPWMSIASTSASDRAELGRETPP